MFTTNHFIWIIICFAVIATAIRKLKKHRPTLKQFLNFACVVCVISECIKLFSMLQMVPSSDGSTMHLYVELGHLPFHLCSIQILFIFYTCFASDGKVKETLLAFMYPTCVAGAFLAIMLPSIFTASIDISQAFTHPLAYQYFLYHSMLVVLGVYIPMSKEVDIQPKHFWSSFGILGGLAFISIYLNSMFATPVYENGELVSVDYSPNFFFTQRTPIGIELTQMWHWYAYMAIIVLIALGMLLIFYAPYIRKSRKDQLQ